MAESQHGRHCGCAECVLFVPRVVPRESSRETATAEQLREAYEAALNEMQALVEKLPKTAVVEPMRKFLTEAGRKLR